MEQYIKSLQDLSTQLKDTHAEQKQLIDKLKWVVNYFGDIIIEENKHEIEQKIDNEKIEDSNEDSDRTPFDYEEPLTESELEGDVKQP